MDWEEVRGFRDSKLIQMDVYQLAVPYSQLTDSQKEELATYRQALLDLPNDYDTPEEAMANIPEKPDWMS
tara:strand:+ start:1542 stop:1751 length:210 start_codon:yes stop_codon:yes gene_type:complete